MSRSDIHLWGFLKRKDMSHFATFSLPTGWDAKAMAGVGAAILNHEWKATY